MIYPVYSLRDRKGEFGAPRVELNEGSARRWFAMMVNNPDPNFPVSFAPHDFELYRIGEFDSKTGDLTPSIEIEFIISGECLVGVGYEK